MRWKFNRVRSHPILSEGPFYPFSANPKDASNGSLDVTKVFFLKDQWYFVYILLFIFWLLRQENFSPCICVRSLEIKS